MILDAKNYSLPIKEIKEKFPEIKQWLNKNNKIDLGNPQALYYYNKCLFKLLDDVDIDLSIQVDTEKNLIPTAGLRRAIVAVIMNLAKPSKIIEIGTGASAIMSLLFAKNGVKVIATEINELSFASALHQIQLNHADQLITLIKSTGGIFDYLEKYFPVDCVLSLPPYYAADTKHIPKPSKRGFQGTDSELYSFGEDIDFSLALLNEWYQLHSSTYLIILWKNLESVDKALSIIKSFKINNQTIEIKAGTRKRYLTITTKV